MSLVLLLGFGLGLDRLLDVLLDVVDRLADYHQAVDYFQQVQAEKCIVKKKLLLILKRYLLVVIISTLGYLVPRFYFIS